MTCPRARRSLLRILESWCLRQASAALFTSRTTLREYSLAFPKVASRMEVIFNGADELDFIGSVDRFEQFTIAHVGTIHDHQAEQAEALLRAFASARALARVPQGARIALVGPVGGALRARLVRLIDALGLGRSVAFNGATSHTEAIAWMRQSNLLVLFGGTNRFFRLSKMSEYLASGRPVLVFANPESETGLEAKAHGWPLITESGPELVLEALVRAVAEGDHVSLPMSLAHPHPLSRFSEAGELAALLNRVMTPSGRRH